MYFILFLSWVKQLNWVSSIHYRLLFKRSHEKSGFPCVNGLFGICILWFKHQILNQSYTGLVTKLVCLHVCRFLIFVVVVFNVHFVCGRCIHLHRCLNHCSICARIMFCKNDMRTVKKATFLDHMFVLHTIVYNWPDWLDNSSIQLIILKLFFFMI